MKNKMKINLIFGLMIFLLVIGYSYLYLTLKKSKGVVIPENKEQLQPESLSTPSPLETHTEQPKDRSSQKIISSIQYLNANKSGEVIPSVKPSLSIVEVQKKLQEVSKSIPTKNELKSLTEEEVHATPLVIRKAGQKLGDIAQLASDHANEPEIIKSIVEFYKDCALNPESPLSIRALCYSHIDGLSQQIQTPFQESDYPQDVRDLAKNLK